MKILLLKYFDKKRLPFLKNGNLVIEMYSHSTIVLKRGRVSDKNAFDNTARKSQYLFCISIGLHACNLRIDIL
jgi:hypothetical protein